MDKYQFASEQDDIRIQVTAEGEEAAWKELDRVVEAIWTEHKVLIKTRMLRVLFSTATVPGK